MMSFTRNDDVFLLSGIDVVTSANIDLVERRDGGHPVGMEIRLVSQREGSARLGVVWNPVSERRRGLGDLVDFTLTLERPGGGGDGDVLAVSFPVRHGEAIDPELATIGAASYQMRKPDALRGAELCFGSEKGLEVAIPMVGRAIGHQAMGWRFLHNPAEPFVGVRFHLGAHEGPLDIRIGRVFVGIDYDPYAFNPKFELIAARSGRPDFGGAAREIALDYERQARAAARENRYIGHQSFVKPFFVRREGATSFPMLVGSSNAISWYAIDPWHTAEWYRSEGYVEPGDTVFDCGAHAGQMGLVFANAAGPGGRVFAFEPFPQNYLQLEAQARLNGLPDFRVTRLGVGARRQTMNVSVLGASTTKLDYCAEWKDEIALEVAPLDEFVEERPNFIKLDVEGAEVDVLKGATRVMRELRPRMSIELHTSLIDRFGYTLTDFFDAIPADLYHVHWRPNFWDLGWTEWKPGGEKDITTHVDVRLLPR